MSTKKIVLTGGGTAGHVLPNLALLPYLSSFDEIHYIGSQNGMEEGIVKKHTSIIYHSIPCTKLVRSLTPRNISVPIKLLSSVRKAKRILKEISPTVIFSKGGFVSLPVCLAAKNICPVVLHESDLSLGLANKLSKSSCDKILTSFSTKVKSAIHVGAPLRKELYEGSKSAARQKHRIYTDLPVLLVTGGSLGAKAINDAVEKALPALTQRYFIVHVAGKSNHKDLLHHNYLRLDFADDMPDLYALADCVLCRGGANTLFEAIALKKPALVIPLPKASSRGDQIENARYFENKGLCRVLYEENLSTSALIDKLNTLSELKSRLEESSYREKIDGTKKIATILSEYAK